MAQPCKGLSSYIIFRFSLRDLHIQTILVAVQGFQQQTKSWPEQPLDSAIRWLKKQPKKARVADFGCGDAGLARAVSQQVASLDLVATSPEVTACDMGATPLGEPGIPTPICFVKGVESVTIVMEINFG